MKLTSIVCVRDLINILLNILRDLWPPFRLARHELEQRRDSVDKIFFGLSQQSKKSFEGGVLIDAQWDNPNYWLRVSLLRAALGLPNGKEVGLLGDYSRRACARTLKILGVHEQLVFSNVHIDMAAVKKEARRLVEDTSQAEDILKWKLPGAVPGHMIYDGILKKQRLASVDITRRDFFRLTLEGLVGIYRSQMLLDQHDLTLVIVSHPIGFTSGVLAYQALKRKIPVVLPFGLFGVLRFTSMTRPSDLTRFYDRPTSSEMDSLPPRRRDALCEIGSKYLSLRFQGCADDLASLYAYRKNPINVKRDELCREFNWDPGKPIVGFYASNWYDWPHQLGMTQFRDFLDWTQETFLAAAKNNKVNWLFKPHPCEQWFGGVSLSEILSQLGALHHIGIANSRWNNFSVMTSIDSLITYHGTSGIEFAGLGKPVLVPDHGKYDDCGFVRTAKDRADYIRLLGENWWTELDLKKCANRAKIFAGWWFCAPDWQGNFVLPDDSKQNELYEVIPKLLAENSDVVKNEIRHISNWFISRHPYSHTSKMMKADRFQLTNV